MLRNAISNAPISNITLETLGAYCRFENNGDTLFAIPDEWNEQISCRHTKIIHYNGNLSVKLNGEKRGKLRSYLIISNGRFATHANPQWFHNILAKYDTPIVAVNIDPALQSYRERIRVTTSGDVAGFRRLYSDCMLPDSIPSDWPHHLFIKYEVLNRLLVDGALPLTFAELVSRSACHSLSWLSLKIAGNILCLETEAGLHSLLTTQLHSKHCYFNQFNGNRPAQTNHKHDCVISSSARMFGRVVLGKKISIGDNAIIIGPTILADNVKIGPSAVIRASVIGGNIKIPGDSLVQNQILFSSCSQNRLLLSNSDIVKRQLENTLPSIAFQNGRKNKNFRIWSWFSYPRFPKRVADIIASLLVLGLFAPIFPLIVLVIKLSSPGPLFFKHKREGLHGKEFFCLKFRTMIIGADSMQEKLRYINQVDGPQFKLKDDPRVTRLGKFLRNTFIDEIPQFANILVGQMSVVGPRPSPNAENSRCPFWRDARLSVRPGITGLWQIYRTRRSDRDFQEWIYYDIIYVRNSSLRLDFLTCWKTIIMIIKNLINRL